MSVQHFKDKLPLSDQEREQWVASVSVTLAQDWSAKVKAGRIEHKCDLGNVTTGQLIREGMNEVLDQYSYLAELERRMILTPPRLTTEEVEQINKVLEFLAWARKWVPHKKAVCAEGITNLEALCRK